MAAYDLELIFRLIDWSGRKSRERPPGRGSKVLKRFSTKEASAARVFFKSLRMAGETPTSTRTVHLYSEGAETYLVLVETRKNPEEMR